MAITINGDGSITGLSAGGLPNDSVTLANLAHGTDGQIITYDASGAPVALGPGSDGQVLTSTGAGSPPAFEANTQTTGLLQYVYTNYGTEVNMSNTSYATTGVTASITPEKSSSHIIGIASLQARGHTVSTTDWGYNVKVQRASTDIYDDDDSSDYVGVCYFNCPNSLHFANKNSWIFKDTGHSTTSAVTYTVYAKAANSGEGVNFQDGKHYSQLILLEVG